MVKFGIVRYEQCPAKEEAKSRMTYQDEARAAIRALLSSAADPGITDAQARSLVEEARENACIAFGDLAAQELIHIVVNQAIQVYETGANRLDKMVKSKNARAHDF